MTNIKYQPGYVFETKKGPLTYLRDTGRRNPTTGNVIGEWSCFCGSLFQTMNRNITAEKTKSCGCLQKEFFENLSVKAKTTFDSPEKYLHSIHNTIIQRCTNKNYDNYHNYGAKGIIFFEEWMNNKDIFINYILENLGPRPTDYHQLDRIDNSKGYIPGNIRWVTPKENCRNRSTNLNITIDGQTKTAIEWSEISGLSSNLIYDRISMGWTGKDLLSSPREKKIKIDMTDLFDIWTNMVSRCTNPKNLKYANYGGRGIKVCADWINNYDKFENEIISNIGERPSGLHQLDRIDVNGNYEINNLRWATNEQNNRNRRDNFNITINGVTKTLSEWSKESGLIPNVIKFRINKGWPEHDWLRIVRAGMSEENILKVLFKSEIEEYSMNSYSKETGIDRKQIVDLQKRRGPYEGIGSFIEYKEFFQQKYPSINVDKLIEEIKSPPRVEKPEKRVNNKVVTVNGESKTISEWSELRQIPIDTIRSRLRAGKQGEDLFVRARPDKFSIQEIVNILEIFDKGGNINKISQNLNKSFNTIKDVVERQGAYQDIPSLTELRQQLSSTEK